MITRTYRARFPSLGRILTPIRTTSGVQSKPLPGSSSGSIIPKLPPLNYNWESGTGRRVLIQNYLKTSLPRVCIHTLDTLNTIDTLEASINLDSSDTFDTLDILDTLDASDILDILAIGSDNSLPIFEYSDTMLCSGIVVL